MKNVTITLDEELALWARVEAAKAGVSLSRYLAEVLAERRAGRRATVSQREAMRRFLSGPGWPGVTEDRPTREELYAEQGSELLHRHKRPAVRGGRKSAGKAGNGGRVARRAGR